MVHWGWVGWRMRLRVRFVPTEKAMACAVDPWGLFTIFIGGAADADPFFGGCFVARLAGFKVQVQQCHHSHMAVCFMNTEEPQGRAASAVATRALTPLSVHKLLSP